MSEITKPLSDWLRESVRSGLMFGRHDEPLDAYGLRLVRVILTEVEAAEGATNPARVQPEDVSPQIGSATECLSCRRLISERDEAVGNAAAAQLDVVFYRDVSNAQRERADKAESERDEARKARDEYLAALKAIRTAVRGDEKSECWTIRKWLDKRGVFNDDLGSVERLIEAVCVFAFKKLPPDPARFKPLAKGKADGSASDRRT